MRLSIKRNYNSEDESKLLFQKIGQKVDPPDTSDTSANWVL